MSVNDPNKVPRIGQVAIVTSDMQSCIDFYTQVIGLEYAFGTNAFRGEGVDAIQGLSKGANSAHWLLDGRPGFQLELFQYESPKSKPLDPNRDPYTVGYNRVIIAVKSLGQALVRLQKFQAGIPPRINHGAHPGILVKDPNGVVLEIMEAPEWVSGDSPSTIIGVGLTVADMATLKEDLCKGFNFLEVDNALFDHDHNWPQGDPALEHKIFQLGDMFVVATQPPHPVRRDEDHCLADIGIMNFAVLFYNHEQFDTCLQSASQLGMQPNCEPMVEQGKASLTYNNTREGFSVEMIYLAEKIWGLYGFRKPTWIDRLLTKILEWQAARNYRKHLKTYQGK